MENILLTDGHGIIRRMRESGARFIPRISVYDTVTSTNTLLKELAEGGEADGRVVIALSQTEGRGRMGRSFHSPKGSGLYVSILLRPTLPARELLLLTPMTAVALARALDESGCDGPRIKWVNDIYVSGKKAAGILVEGAPDADGGMRYAVVGIGVNLTSPEGGFPDGLRDVACGAFDGNGGDVDAQGLIASLLRHFYDLYASLPSRDFMDEYRRRSCLMGQSVTVTVGKDEFRGKVTDIDADGHLTVECEDGVTRSFSSGEARARPTPSGLCQIG